MTCTCSVAGARIFEPTGKAVEPGAAFRQICIMPKQRRPVRPRAPSARSALALGGLLAIGASVWIWARFYPSPTATAPVTNAPGATFPASAVNTSNAAAFLGWLAQQTNATEVLGIGSTLLEQGRAGQGVLCFRRVLELTPANEEAAFNLGVALSRLGDWAGSEQAYRRALTNFPEYVEAQNNLGNLLARQKRYDEAVEILRTALQAAPDSATAHNNLGRVLAEQGKPMEALERFTEAAKLDTNYTEARFNIGAAYLTMGQTNEARAAFRETLRLRPDFAPAVRALKRIDPVP